MLEIVVGDIISPFNESDAAIVKRMGCECIWPYRNESLMVLMVPDGVCDGKVVKALRDNGHPNILRRRDVVSEAGGGGD
jgi:hypothetical protein